MTTLYIIRGLPGSGKTTFATQLALALGIRYFEADFYFYSAQGDYNFDATKIYDAHKWCQRQVQEELEAWNSVIVSNTNTTEKEMKVYLDMADYYDAKVVSLIVERRHDGKSIHNVPEETLEKMKQRFSVKL